MQMIRSTQILILSIIFSSCTIYKSADRKEFEATYSRQQIENLSLISCSESTVESYSDTSKLISVQNSIQTGDSNFIWEHQIGRVSVIESNDLKGTYCLYEKNN